MLAMTEVGIERVSLRGHDVGSPADFVRRSGRRRLRPHGSDVTVRAPQKMTPTVSK